MCPETVVSRAGGRPGRVVFFSFGIGAWNSAVFAADVDGPKPAQKVLAQGRELFEREWLPGDSRSHGGDGLGPVYNDSSCVACHNLGGPGGGGRPAKTSTSSAPRPMAE